MKGTAAAALVRRLAILLLVGNVAGLWTASSRGRDGGGGIAFSDALRVTELTVTKFERLRRAMHSAEPWLVGCKRSGGRKEAGEKGAQKRKTKKKTKKKRKGKGAKALDEWTSDFLSRTAQQLEEGKHECTGCRLGEIDCDEKMPSGKSFASHYNIRRTPGVPTLLMATGGTYKQLEPVDFTKKDKSDKTKAMLSEAKLARKFAKSAVPKVVALKNDADLRAKCTKLDLCVLLMLGDSGGKSVKLSRRQRRTAESIMEKHRGVGFASVDMSKWTLDLGSDSYLIPNVPEGASDALEVQPPRVVILSRSKDDDGEKAQPAKAGYRHLNAASKIWEAKPGSKPKVALSLCKHLMMTDTTRAEARKIFEKHKVSFSEITAVKKPETVLRDPRALYRINGRYYAWPVARPFLSSMALFEGAISGDVLERLDKKLANREKREEAKAAAARPAVSRAQPFVGEFSEEALGGHLSKLNPFSKSSAKARKAMARLEKRPRLRKFVSEAEKRQRAKSRRDKLEKRKREREQRKKKLEKLRRRRGRRTKVSEEERKKEQLARERARREEMDREGADIVTAVDPDEDSSDEHGSDDSVRMNGGDRDGNDSDEEMLDDGDVDMEAEEEEAEEEENSYLDEDAGDEDDDEDEDDDDEEGEENENEDEEVLDLDDEL
eukprot:g2461.t1